MGGYAWVTLATNDSYSLGALVLAHSLKQTGTVHQLAVLVTPGVTGIMREKLATVFNVVREVNILDSGDEANLRLLKRPELGVTFTKLHCWRLTQFEKCVFLDADTMVLANADELFDREEFSAAPDVGWPDCFNSGVFVYRPSEETYTKLVQFALDKGSFDGGDQGLLNLYFSDWAHKDISKHLPFIYNMCSTACYSYLPAFKQFGPTVKIIHFIGNTKPWLQYFDTETQHVQVVSDIQHLHGVVQQWWNIFCSCIHPILSPEMPTSRAPTTVHYPSFPNFGHTSHGSSGPDNSFFNVEESKSDYRNAFDPWEEYENRLDNYVNEEEHTEHVPHFDNTVAPVPTESYHDSYHFIDQSAHITVDTFHTSSNNNNSVNINYEEPRDDNNISSDRHAFHFSNNHSSKQSHIEQSFQPSSPEINTSSATIDPPLECNQLARPHECEPTSSVTNESALHDHPNEAHDASAGLAGAFARLTLGVARTPEQAFLEDQLRKQGWEVGNIDYTGRDAFDNIWSKICETLNTRAPPQSQAPPPPAAPAPAVATKQADTEATREPQISEQKTVIEKKIEPVAAAPLSPIILPLEPASELVPRTVEPSFSLPLMQTTPISVRQTSPAKSIPEATPKQTTPTPSSQPDPPKQTPSTPVSPSSQLESVKQTTPTSTPPEKQSSQEPPKKAASPEKQVSPQSDPPKQTAPTPVQPSTQLEHPNQTTSIIPTPTPSEKQAVPSPIAPSDTQVSSQPEPPKQTESTPEKPATTQSVPLTPEKQAIPSLIALSDTQISSQPEPPKQTASTPQKPASTQSVPPKQATPISEKQATPTPVPSEKQATPTPVPSEKQATPTPVPSEKQATPTPVPSEKQATPTPVPSEKQTTPASAQPEPAKPQATPPKKQPETPKMTPPPPKSKKDSPPKAVAEPTKPTVNVPKPAAEQTSGQKAAPQSPNAESPTPPPRKGASGQASAKKSGKGKK